MSGVSENGSVTSTELSRLPIVHNRQTALTRFPLLSDLVEAAATETSLEISALCGKEMALVAKAIEVFRVGEDEFRSDAPSRVWVSASDELKCNVAFWVAHPFVRVCVELLFGAHAPSHHEGRAQELTKIEERVAELILRCLQTGFCRAFKDVAEVGFKTPAIVQPSDLSDLGRKGSFAFLCAIEAAGIPSLGTFGILMPRTALDPYQQNLSRGQEKTIEDARWSDRLKQQLVQTTVKISAMMETRSMTLGDIAALRVGQVIPMPYSPSDPIPLMAEDRRLFECSLGQSEGSYTIRIEHVFDSEHEFFQGILPE